MAQEMMGLSCVAERARMRRVSRIPLPYWTTIADGQDAHATVWHLTSDVWHPLSGFWPLGPQHDCRSY